MAEPARPAEAGAGCLLGSAGLGCKILGPCFPFLVITVGVLGPGVFGGEIHQDGIRQESVTKMRETPSLIFQFLSSHIISYHHQATH